MDTRRHHHHHGGRGHNNGHRRGRGGGRGGRGGGSHFAGAAGPARGSYWFKGEGYNDHEAVSIDEEVVGISGFLSQAQPGFSGLVKQRFSDFIVHEVAKNGQVVTLTSLAKKKKHVHAQFYDLVAGFLFGTRAAPASANDTAAHGMSEAEQSACLDVLKDVGVSLGRQGHELKVQGRRAMEARDIRKLVALVTSELGAAKGKDFEAFIAHVVAHKAADAERLAAALAAAAVASESPSVVNAEAAAAAWAATAAAQETADELVFYIGGLNEKRERVFLHETMRRYGKGLIVADTITSEDQSQVIRVRRTYSPSEGKKGDRDTRKSWPLDQPEYLQFVLYRRNKDIVSVVNQIASVLKVHPSIFSYAEAKDKRGITTQLVTAHRLQAEKLQVLQKFYAGKSLDEYQYLIGGNLKYVPTKVAPGDCLGNRFSVVIRALGDNDLVTPDAVDAALAHWSARGFVNFFGLQRFGHSATPSHLIGRAVLRKDFKLAVLLLLRPQEGEASKIRAAREHFRQHKDVAAALRMLPPFLVPERAVLDGLLQHGMDANELAFRTIPRSYRVAYVDAYMSYVWNEMASRRVAELPSDAAVVGDLVFAKKDARGDADDASEPASKRLKRTDSSGQDVPVRTVIALTEANVHEYTIDDVILPLPGHSVLFPTHAVGAAYQKMLTTDGVDMASWLGASAQLHQYDQLGGAYRFVIKKPTHVRGHVRTYDDVHKPLQLTDVDRLLRRELDSVSTGTAAAPAPAPAVEGAPETSSVPQSESAPSPSAEPKRVQRALVLEFALDAGSDATIAVRELMKQSSSMHIQWQLADRAQSEDAKAVAAGASAKPAAASATGAKRPRGVQVGGALASKTGGGDKKIIAQKKTQVSIGRPGFSLGKH